MKRLLFYISLLFLANLSLLIFHHGRGNNTLAYFHSMFLGVSVILGVWTYRLLKI